MNAQELEKLRYPIGKFELPTNWTTTLINEKISIISQFPNLLKNTVQHFTKSQLDTPYRPEGWTVRQLIHHCAESHMHCFIRIKWALTEINPIIKPYDESLWADLYDSKNLAITPSLLLLEGLHQRLVFLLQHLTNEDLEKSYVHPEHNQEFKIKEVIALYAWHCQHHLSHIAHLKKANHWK